MKKITLSVAALSLAISGSCIDPKVHKDGNKSGVHGIDLGKDPHWQPNQFNLPTNKQLVKEIMWTTEDLIEWVKEDEFHSRMMTKELADIYVKNLLKILSSAEDLQIKQCQIEYNNSLDCCNCDEID